MTGGEWKVEITGLREFQAALKKMDRDLPRQLAKQFKSIAGKVAGQARGTVPHRSGDAAGSIKASGTQKGAFVTGGGARVPYYPWLDFGGAVGRRKSVKRDFLPGGRYIYPAAHDLSGETFDAAQDAIRDAAKGAGFGWLEF